MLELTDATFLYAPGRGIDGATLRAVSGECVGVIGPNGAGKSTLLGLAAAALVPQSGRVRLTLTGAGGRGRQRRYDSDIGIGYRRHVGYLPERAPVCPEMTVAGYLRFRAALRGESFLRVRRRVEDILERCALRPLRKTRLAGLSFGVIRRVAVAEAMLTHPALLVLDDPFAGADLAFRESFAELLRAVAQRSCVLIGGHDPELLATCCNRFVLVERARVTAVVDDYEEAVGRLREAEARPAAEEVPAPGRKGGRP